MIKKYQSEFSDYSIERIYFWNKIYKSIPNKISSYYHKKINDIYSNLVPQDVNILELGCATGSLIKHLKPSRGIGLDFSEQAILEARKDLGNITFILSDAHKITLPQDTFDFIIVSELVNDLWDVQAMLTQLHPYCAPHTRLIFNFYSHLWNAPFRLAQKLGLKTPNLPQNWLTKRDMENLLEISGFEPLRSWSEIICPVPIPFIANFSNRYLSKIFPFSLFAIANFIVARPLSKLPVIKPSVSVIVAARNESGHIEELMGRMPIMGRNTEIIFVEGNSTDDTYEAIEKSIASHPELKCRLLKQLGRGKGDAVRAGFDVADGDILMILDADITVPPEDLPRFYELMLNGAAEFVNGVRLVYPMNDDAMRFANLLGNKFFSWAFSWLLGQPIRDTLCGTKVLWRSDYHRIAKNRSYFGDFDPFGDFDLLFGAARLNLKIMEVPIRYRARRYGETNISRWTHGWLLLKMVIFASRRIKFV